MLDSAGTCRLLRECWGTLAPCTELLLEIVFCLAADGWPSVAEPCRAWLAAAKAEGALQALMPGDALEGFLGRLLRELVPAVQSLEADGAAHALRLAAALQVVPSQSLAGQQSHCFPVSQNLQKASWYEAREHIMLSLPGGPGMCQNMGMPFHIPHHSWLSLLGRRTCVG